MTTVIFGFLGRRANIELQLPFITRILAENPNVEFHVWNLAKTAEDDRYIRGLAPLERMTVRNDFWSSCPWTGFDNVYRWYANQDDYADTLFVKIDDDIVFLQTGRFAQFMETARAHPGYITSAFTINNGASSPELHSHFQGFDGLTCDLLDVHESNHYAELSHRHMFDHWRDILAQPLEPTPTKDWLSINCIAFNHQVMRTIANTVGSQAPRYIAGRDCGQWPYFGDEGVANTLPRIIVNGFLAAHLTFGPQSVTDEQADLWRKQYAAIAQEYLA